MKVIEIIVDPAGQTRLQTKGFTGSSCEQASRFIEDALGEKITDTRTAEFFGTQTVQAPVREQS